MKTPIALILTGILFAAVSVGTWLLIRTTVEQGDPASFEQALTASASRERWDPSEAPFANELPLTAGVDQAPEGPRFTIGAQESRTDRVPVGLRIPSLGRTASIIAAGVEVNGDMEVPENVSEVAWYKYGPVPGEPGSAVLAAHVDLAGQGPGVFFDLRVLELGSEIWVDFDDGTSQMYFARARTVYEKEDLPTEALFSREGPSVLTLITCGGDFNRSILRYDSNVVVYASVSGTDLETLASRT